MTLLLGATGKLSEAVFHAELGRNPGASPASAALWDHRVSGRPLLPGAAFLELAHSTLCLAGVHLLAQPKPFLSLKLHETTQRIPAKVLTSSRIVDQWKPLASGAGGGGGVYGQTVRRRSGLGCAAR